MGAIEKRARYKEEFCQEILNQPGNSLLMMDTKNIQCSKLAKKIDYSPTTIYLYFKGKDSLLLAICEEIFCQFLVELNRIRSVSQDAVEILRKSFLYLLEFGLKKPNQYKVFFHDE